MGESEPPNLAGGHLGMPEAEWQVARLRAEVIGRLAARDVVDSSAADEAATELGISRRQVYLLVHRCRAGSGLVTDLVPGQSSGGAGGSRLDEQVEAIIAELVRTRFLTRRKRSVGAVHREIRRVCVARGLPAPARNTVAARIDRLRPVEVARRRGGPDAARPLQSAGDEVPQVGGVLDQVQIDHTVIDVIVVDELERRPVGRPYLTVGIDVFSRSLVGMVVTLEPPSATSVGLCLAHMVGDKRPWLEQLGVQATWPMSGKPATLYLDNAKEFKSEALTRGCDQHGITLSYRPPGRPHYGGIVERVIGTAMQRVHELPGTTFSNPAQRGDYDSSARAVLTLDELNKWLVLAVASYHGTVHSTLGQTPAGKWTEGIEQGGPPTTTVNLTAFLIDFLPVVRRTLTRTGFVIDYVHYFANALKPWISRREQLDRFVIRRDPRDISRVWVLDPDGTSYVEVPYRMTGHPAVSVWEHRQALARLKERGDSQVDEAGLFAMIDQMRQITQEATRTTKRSRREGERRRHAPSPTAERAGVSSLPVPPGPPAVLADDEGGAARFEEIQQW